jgi:two-component system, LuxR family, response regulator DctR
MTDKPTVYLCDDDEEVRRSLAFSLRQNDLQVSAHASGPELLAAIDAAPKPLRGVFVLDERMVPMTGSQVHAHLLARGLAQRNPVLFLSGHGTVPVAVDAMAKGAITFVVKGATVNVIVPRILEALEQESLWFAKAVRCQELTAMWQGLPPQQKRVTQWLVAGTYNKVTARYMALSERTVEEHRKKLLANLGVGSAPELATLLAEIRSCGIDTTSGGPNDSVSRAIGLPGT